MVSRFLALLLPLVLLAACRSTEDERAHASPATPAGVANAPALPAYTLVLIKTGPKSGQLPAEDNEKAFAGHFANMTRMAEADQLVVAGPYGQARHDESLRGIFVLTTSQRAEAERWAGTDPTTQAGVFTLEFHDLETAAPLRAALERDRAARAAALAAGREPRPGEGARPYVLLTAEHGDLAERELGELRTRDGGVLLLGKLDGHRAFAILDAEDLATAHDRFGPRLAEIGAHTLDEWFASGELARMVD